MRNIKSLTNLKKAISMQVEEKTVRKIANLARIKITDKEVKALEGELSRILQWVEQLEEVDTTDVEPMASVEDQSLSPRKDVVNDGGIPEKITANAPLSEDNFFMVPTVVE